MRRAGLIAAAWLLVAQAAWAQDVLVRSSRQPGGPVMLGQPVHLYVDVLFAGEMPHPPRVAAPHVEGAQVLRFESQGTTLSDRIGGVAYTGQRFEFDLYPRRAGTLAVPPAQVTLLDAAGNAVGTRTGQGLSVRATVPPGLDPSGPIVASTAVTLDQQWQPAETTRFHVGDALARVVTRSAAGVPGLALAPLDFQAPAGIRAYADAPVIEDRVERGAVTGRRVDRVTYVFEQAGAYTLPGLAQPWWDLRGGGAHTLSLPALSVGVAGAPAVNAPLSWVWLAPGVLLAAVLAAFMWRKRVRRWIASWRANEERARFGALRQTCRGTDAAATYRAWQQWNAVRASRSKPPGLAAPVETLEGALFSRGKIWTADDARGMLRAARSARARSEPRRPSSALPPLNPIQ